MIDLTIDRVAAGGSGVGRDADGRVVFVPRTAPGDVATVEIVQQKDRFGIGRLGELQQPGLGRTEPSCVHYVANRCGGCQFQHLTADVQREVKGAIVGDALRRIGKLKIENPPLISSPLEWRYRSKITFTRRSPAPGAALGLHTYDDPPSLFEPDDCLITRERVMKLWALIREHRDQLPRSLQTLVIKEDREGGLHVVADVGEAKWNPARLAAAVGDPSVCWWCRSPNEEPRLLSGPETGFPSLVFEQSNAELADRIRLEAVRSLGVITGGVVWDLYGGVGDTAALLAGAGALPWTVDADVAAVQWAKKRGVRGTHYVAGRVERVLGRLPEPDAVIVNPPRAGLAKAVTARLNQWGAARPDARLAYVSCDPATLARDLLRLSAFRLGSVTAYDLFPQTAHVEVLASLRTAS